MIVILAQAASQHADPQGPTWMWIVTAICLPIMMLALGGILWRLRNGDEKFERLAVNMATVVESNNNVKERVDQAAKKIDSASQQISEVGTQAMGAVAELKSEIAKEYLPRQEFQQHCERMDNQHREVMEAIANIRRGRQ